MDSVFHKVTFPSADGKNHRQFPLHRFVSFFTAGSSERDPDDGRPLGLVNRRPSISAPISARKPSGSRVHSPLPTSPSELLIGDGASSTPKRLADGKSEE